MPKNFYFAYRSFWPELETVRRFAEIGVDTFCLFPGNTCNSLGEPYCKYPPNRLWFGRYDFAPVDRQFDDLLDAAPGAKVLCMVDLNSPEWLARNLNLSHESGDSMTHLGEAVSNARWREDTEKYLLAVIDHLEKRYPGTVCAYILACGNTDEWFDHNSELCGMEREKQFLSWCSIHHENCTRPPSALKLNTPDFDGFLFDPALSPDVFAYRKFCNGSIAGMLRHFAAVTRKVIPATTEIGAFYGYTMNRIGMAASGHSEFENVLHDENIDFLISPGIYSDRIMGGGSGSQSPDGSQSLIGKHLLLECDQRTHTYNPDLAPGVRLEFPHWENTREDIAGLRREFSLALLHNMSLWWFDMWGGFYQEDALYAELKRMLEIYRVEANVPVKSTAPVMIVTDSDSYYYSVQRDQRQREFIPELREKLSRAGVPFACHILHDLPHIEDLSQTKVILFADCWEMTPEKQAIIDDYARKEGRTLLWCYAAGLSDGKKLDPEGVKKLTGAPFGTPGISERKGACWRDLYAASPKTYDVPALRRIFEESGVPLWVPENVIVYANSRFFALHTIEERVCRIPAPETASAAVELFSGRRVPVENGKTVISLKGPVTELWQWQ